MLLEHLLSFGVESRPYYPIPLHLQRCYSDLGYRKGDLPVSEWAADNTLAIPVYPELEAGEIEWIIDVIKKFSEISKIKIQSLK